MRSLGQRLLTGFHHPRQRPWQTLLSVGLRKSILQLLCPQGQSKRSLPLIDDQETIPNRNGAARAWRLQPQTT
jgi:hypothetical protein